MKKIGVFVFFFYCGTLFSQYTDKDIINYIEQYRELAIKKMYEYKIPASITLAQGIFESACGTSRLATYGNNHFGIKCHKEWEGDTLRVDDDALQECFRKYDKVEDSYNDHSLFLTSRTRYGSLFALDIMDYKAWANGLKACGYATNPKYADRLINLIERFNMAKQDTICLQRMQSGWFTNPKIALKETERLQQDQNAQMEKNPKKMLVEGKTGKQGPVFIAKEGQYPMVHYPFTDRTVYEYNKTLFVIAKDGDTYKIIAKEVQDAEKNIRKFNDVEKGKEPMQGEVVYIEQKSKHHPNKIYIVQTSDNLRYISQKHGIQLNYIFKYNNLNEKSVIHPGDKIMLKH
ncbi:MAG: glucosaminidase domain-containing protein [Bacteroidales bacterium]